VSVLEAQNSALSSQCELNCRIVAVVLCRNEPDVAITWALC
jgi:hypothetical protein